MEETKVIVTLMEKADAIRSHTLFKWELVNEEQLIDNKYRLHFRRDDSFKRIEEVKKLEKEYFRISIVPTWVLILLLALAFVLVTLFGALTISKVISLDSIPQTLLLIGPTASILIVVVILTRIRLKGLKKYIDGAEERYQKYKSLMEDINNG